MSGLRSMLYTLAKMLGDIQALRSGRIGQRVGRRILGRMSGQTMGRIFK